MRVRRRGDRTSNRPPAPTKMKGSNVEGVDVTIIVHRAEGLIAKDRNMFGKRTSSDPYVRLVLAHTSGPRHLGRTQTLFKNLNPVWEKHFQFSVDKRDVPRLQSVENGYAMVQLQVFDEDQMTADDLMGIVSVQFSVEKEQQIVKRWLTIPSNSAKNAQGRIQVSLKTSIARSRNLVRGNTFPIPSTVVQGRSAESMNPTQAQQTLVTNNSNTIIIGLAWDMLPGNQFVDLDASLVAINNTGNVSMKDTVYYGNLVNSNGSVKHTGDEQEGDEEGDDERITVDLARIPPHIIAMYVILTVATPDRRLPDIQSTRVRILTQATNTLPTTTTDNPTTPTDNPTTPTPMEICSFAPAQHALSKNATAMFMVRLSRHLTAPQQWNVSPIQDTHPVARDFGVLVPHLKQYTTDLLPNIVVDPTERIAILQKGGNINLNDYCSHHHIPQRLRFGLAWDVTDGVNIDLDASVICLDQYLNLVENIYFRNLRSNDGAIKHNGDERQGDELGDDETIDIHLNMINPKTHYLGFVINSYSGQELDDVARASCHLFDPVTHVEIATYALSNAASLNGYTALVMACLYRGDGGAGGSKSKEDEWGLVIISEAAMGKTVHDNVDELQNYLRKYPPRLPVAQEVDIDLSQSTMPSFVPLVADDEEIDLSATPTATATILPNTSAATTAATVTTTGTVVGTVVADTTPTATGTVVVNDPNLVPMAPATPVVVGAATTTTDAGAPTVVAGSVVAAPPPAAGNNSG